jgi:hypothetical protein
MWENHVSCCTTRQPISPMKNVTGLFIITLCVNLHYKKFIFSSLCLCIQAYLSLCESGFFIDLNHFLKLWTCYISINSITAVSIWVIKCLCLHNENYTNKKGKFVIWVHLKACLGIEGSVLVLIQDMYNTYKVCI